MPGPSNATYVGMSGYTQNTSFNTKDTKLGYSNGDAVDNSAGNNPVNGSSSETIVPTTTGSKEAVFINPPATGAIYPNS